MWTIGLLHSQVIKHRPSKKHKKILSILNTSIMLYLCFVNLCFQIPDFCIQYKIHTSRYEYRQCCVVKFCWLCERLPIETLLKSYLLHSLNLMVLSMLLMVSTSYNKLKNTWHHPQTLALFKYSYVFSGLTVSLSSIRTSKERNGNKNAINVIC